MMHPSHSKVLTYIDANIFTHTERMKHMWVTKIMAAACASNANNDNGLLKIKAGCSINGSIVETLSSMTVCVCRCPLRIIS